MREYPPILKGFAGLMSNSTAFRSYMCVVCGFIYNEVDGLPDEGLAPGTRWDDIPDSWVCPDCGVTKADFEMVEM